MLPTNIRVDMNCQPTWVTQNAIPGERELILLGGGGHYDPLQDKVGLIVKYDKEDNKWEIICVQGNIIMMQHL